MSDDTSFYLSMLLKVEPWDVVSTIESIAEAATRVEELELLVEELVEQGDRHRLCKARRKQKADSFSAESGRFRNSILAALKRGKRWELDEKTYYSLVGEPCYACGSSTGGGIGLDRIDSNGAYDVDNVRPCCGPCNVMRGRPKVG